MIQLPFVDRDQAAHALADALAKYKGSHPVVLAIPRGAVPMGRIIAEALGGELDVVLVRKLGAPGNSEFAIGAVDERGSIIVHDSAAWSGVSEAYIQREAREQLKLIRERRTRYGAGDAIPLDGRTVIVVDDGLATGATMAAALRAVREQRPAWLICAVPVAALDSLSSVERLADAVVCLATPSPFRAVGRYYRDFAEVTDEDVTRALQGSSSLILAVTVRISAGATEMEGDLCTPASPLGIVIFAHGSGSSRHSTRNRFVADVLNQSGIATLLFDLLTPREDMVRATRFDIELLTQRLQAAVKWAREEPRCRGLPLGLFGASTGAAAALCVAALQSEVVAAVVSRGGRPDLAGGHMLARVRAPVLLIVGGADYDVLALNRSAQESMKTRTMLEIVPGAGHLFEEPGALEKAATLAAEWFVHVFRSGGTR